MIIYEASFRFDKTGDHAQLLDWPAVVTCGADLGEARMMIRSAQEDMAEAYILDGDPLPRPVPALSDPESDVEEPVDLQEPTTRGICKQLRASPAC